MTGKINKQSGEMNALLIPLLLAVVVGLSLAGFSGWAYIKYADARDNVDSKIAIAVAEARQDQQTKDAKEAAEREKEPYEVFVGPDELGRVEFQYPKTWSVYVADDGAGGNYVAALHPKLVHPLESGLPYALRLEIVADSYEAVISEFQDAVVEGDLRSEPVVVNGFNGIKLSGKFSDEVPNAELLVFKVRDKTMKIGSEAPQYFADFNNIILQSLRFSP